MMTKEFINSFNIISHSEPKRKLIVHLDEVYTRAKKRFDELNINFNNLSVNKKDFEDILKVTILCHDFGKSSIYFQNKILDDKNEGKLSEHGLISAFFGYFVANELFEFNKTISSFVFMAIRYHHLNLNNADEMQLVDTQNEYPNVLKIFEGIKDNFEEIDKIYKYFFEIEYITNSFDKFIKNDLLEYNEFNASYFYNSDLYEENDIYLFMLLFSLLVYSDKQDAIYRDDIFINEKKLITNAIKVEEFKKKYFEDKEITPLDRVREKIYQDILREFDNKEIKTNKIFFVKLPTGAGKTLLLYKLAMLINEVGNYQKIFYLLPFITLIEQNAQILKSLLSFMDVEVNDNRVFLEKHSLSGEFEISGIVNDEYDIDKKQFLLDTLESKYIVTSFHQLFYGVFKRKNGLLKRFHQFANSIILIDEVQLIPLKHTYLISKFLKFMSQVFKCKIIVASATFPNISKDILSNSCTLKSVDEILSKEEIDKFFDRYEMDIDLDVVYDYDQLFFKVDEKLTTKRDLLFRVNTINSANAIYDYLILTENNTYKKENIFLLTSAITPYRRKEIISLIKENSKQGVKQIVVATQLIQAGVDISLEDGIEELAPLDLIIQSMGRRNRSGEKTQIGKADIIIIKNDNGFEGYKIYNEFDIEQTKKTLQEYKSISEKEILNYELLDRYYNSQPKITKIDELFKKLEYSKIDKHFTLISSAPLSFSFFIPLNNRAIELWEILKELDTRKKSILKDKNFWKNMKTIESEYSKIKKEISLYIVNQNFYYRGSKEKMVIDIIDDFDSALNIYFASDEVFDEEKGLVLNQYVKDKIEGLFW